MFVSPLALAILAVLAAVLLGAGVTLICVFRAQGRRLAAKSTMHDHRARNEPPHWRPPTRR